MKLNQYLPILGTLKAQNKVLEKYFYRWVRDSEHPNGYVIQYTLSRCQVYASPLDLPTAEDRPIGRARDWAIPRAVAHDLAQEIEQALSEQERG